jgi:hypothetical protein
VAVDKDIEGGFDTLPQLYDLSSDPGEQTNVAPEHPERVAEMQAEIERIVADTYR